MKRIPVILDTDIGTDIDDTWALAMMLKCPELDVKLITSDTGNTIYRTKLIAKLLEVAGRTDIPVGIGIEQHDGGGPQEEWVENYDLAHYPGAIHEDGVQALIDTILASEEPMTLICIGPVPNIAEALRRKPETAKKAHFVGMHGSIYRRHLDAEGACKEWNVVADAGAFRALLQAPWLSKTITPLDTCGNIVLDGRRYQKVLHCDEPLMQAVTENYRYWAPHHGSQLDRDIRPDFVSSILFDTVAIYLAFTQDRLEMKRMNLVVTDDGYTKEGEAGTPVDVALNWLDFDGYLDFLVERLTAEVQR